MEDLRQIHDLKKLLGQKETENACLKTTKNEFEGLVANREAMYNQMFNANPFSGVYDPVTKENVVEIARLKTEGQLQSEPGTPKKTPLSIRKRSLLKTGPFRVVNRREMGVRGQVWKASENLSQSLRSDHVVKGFWQTENKMC